jgi:hypothetical protein
MFFVLSTGRCGSTSIRDFLNQAPDCHCVHEPEPQLVSEATLYAYGAHDHHSMVELLKSSRPATVDGRQYGESHHRLSFVFPALNEAFPDARYIWLLRDGRDAVSSFHARGWYTGSQELHVWERWRIQGDRLGDFSSRQWARLTPFEKCCWYWTYVNRRVQRSLDTVAERSLRVRLERLTESSSTVFAFLGLTAPGKPALLVKNVAYQHHIPLKHTEWDKRQAAAFMDYCGAAMDEWYPGWRETHLLRAYQGRMKACLSFLNRFSRI